MFNLSMEKDPALSLLYALFAAAGVLLSITHYWFGQMNFVLSSLVINSAFLLSSSFLFLNRNKGTNKYFNILSLATIAIIIQIQLHQNSSLAVHWLYAFPILTFFALPVAWATVINISIIISSLIPLFSNLPLTEAYRYLCILLLFNLCGLSYGYSNHIKRKNLLKLAVTDYQSGAYNHVHLKSKLHQEVARSKVTNRTLSLLAVTIEDHTQIYEIHGQSVSVSLLREFKDVIYKVLRAGDEVFHNGQGTFYLLLPNCPIEGATVLKERLIKNLDSHAWPEVGELQLNTGFATLNYNESSDAFLQRASQHVTKQQQTALRLLAFND